jgi:hypothetical protein
MEMLEEIMTMTAGEQAEAAAEAKNEERRASWAGMHPDYLAFLLQELAYERSLSLAVGRAVNDPTIKTLERMIQEELDRWGLSEKAELELAEILAERHGSRLEEPR